METDLALLVLSRADCELQKSFSKFVAIDQDRGFVQNPNRAVFFSYPWSSDAVREGDYFFLYDTYIETLDLLSDALNRIHSVNYDTRAWELAFGSWLPTALSVSFDRVKILEFASLAAQGKLAMGVGENNLFPPENSQEFIGLASESEAWNRNVIARAGLFLHEETFRPFELCSTLTASDAQGGRFASSIDFTDAARRMYEAMLPRLLRLSNFGERSKRPRKLVLSKTYFPRLQEARLLWNLRRQFSPQFFRSPKPMLSTPNSLMRKELGKLLLHARPESDRSFLGFFFRLLPDILPMSYLESFEEVSRVGLKLNGVPHLSLTANSHWGDDGFKLWIAGASALGTRVVFSEHGGSFPARNYLFDFEQRSADKYVAGWPALYSNEVQLTIPNFVGLKPVRRLLRGQQLTVIAYAGSQWAIRPSSQPQSYRGLSTIVMAREFLDSLPPTIRKRSVLKLANSRQGWSLFRDGQEQLQTGGTEIKFNSLRSNLRQSKCVICLYPQTTYTEALMSGRPVLLLFDERVSGLHPMTNDLVEAMRASNLFFTDAISAAEFLTKKWPTIEEWWESAEVTSVRQQIMHFMKLAEKNPLRDWVSFLQGQLTDPNSKQIPN